MFRSIKTKILVMQIGFVLSMGVFLGLVTYFIMFQSLRNSQLQYIKYVATHIEEKMNMLIAGKEQLLEKIATSEMVTNYTKKQQENMLVGYFGRFTPEFAALSYVNDKGIGEIELINGETTANILDKSDSVLIARLVQNPNKTLNAYSAFCPEIAGPCIEFGFLNKSFFDEFMGIVLGKVSVIELSKSIQGFEVGQTGSVVLLDSEGTILSCRDRSKILQKIVIEGTEAREAIAGIKAIGSGFGRAKILGLDSYFAYVPVQGQNWVVMTVLPYKEFITRLNTLRNTVLLVGFAIMVVGIILSLLVAKNMTDPILKLVAGTRQIARGDFSYRIHTASRDEIGILTEAFNGMTENLDKTTTSIVNLNYEISERSKAEAALRRSENRFKAVAESAGDWIWEVNTEGLYTYSNPVVEKVLGYKPEEIVGKKYFYDFFAPDVKKELKKAAFEAFAKKESFRGFINPNIHKDCSTVILETTGTPIIDDKGNLCGYRGADRDITNRRKAEQRQAQLLEELKKVNQELKDFAYITSHDLKAPLRGIATLADWISTDYADKLDEQGKEQMNLLIGRVSRMQNLIDGILQYSRIGRVKEKKDVVNLNELVSEVIDLIAPPENITITVENELPTIECEQTRITQVFQNLISNAVKYMDKPQGRIKVGCIEENGFWVFSVSDNGPGIEEKYFEKIFQLFQTLSPRDKCESTGIGLTVAKKIVELCGGKIWVRSKVGEGSTFCFTLSKQEMEVKNTDNTLEKEVSVKT